LLARNSASRLIGTPGSNSFIKCHQVFGKLTLAGLDRQDGRQRRIEHTEPHRVLVRIDDVDGAAATGRRRGRIAGPRRLGEPAEPGSDGGERAHEAARPQQLAPRPSACAQKAIEPLLLDFVHVQQSVCRPPIERAVFDVLADDAGALLVAAAEQAAAIVMVRRRVALALMIVPMRHG
jgi:hypothetical protein